MTFKALNDVLNVRDDPISLSVSVFPEGNNQEGLFKSYYQDDDLSSLDQSDISSSPEFTNLTSAIDPIVLTIEPTKRGRGRLRKFSASVAYLNFVLNIITSVDSTVAPSFAASTNGSEGSKQGKPEIDEMGQINEQDQDQIDEQA
jgi:hypothetical protein